MQTVIILIHLMIVIAMVGLVLIQKSEGGGLGMGGGTGGFLSSRGTANMLTRSTAILAVLFFATSLFLSMLAGFERKPRSILDTSATPAAPTSPATPSSPGSGGVLNQLGGAPQPAPAAPQAPAGPQVPGSQ
jgi:preprotein translocase subunit SecG